jgi:hypothetical protein
MKTRDVSRIISNRKESGISITRLRLLLGEPNSGAVTENESLKTTGEEQIKQG